MKTQGLQPRNSPLAFVTGAPSGPWRAMVRWPLKKWASSTWQSTQPLAPRAMRVGATLWLMVKLT